ncbi:hypothetical protein PGTUg99_024477 [Puccinia graminis f. sp. tritici]|uniref:Uncharacterized protein n=1 Tax=Puccinia graminis f. sp. tritici TaxID=56615 RepID=A0A5B0LR09_PUCGR|nr:hypothetical protein PGTUg99_024477 [Puccinia graminis f. sp. tritici]
MSHTDHSKTTPVKTYSEAVSASEGTRSEPNKTAKAAPRKPKKQFKSPEEVPSEWDESNLSSKSETRKTAATVVKKQVKSAATVVKKQVKSASRPKSITDNGPISPPAIPAERPESTDKSQATALPIKKRLTVPAKSDDPLPITDPFKSNEKPSKLIDKDSISHLSFKKLDREPLAKTINNAAETSTDQAPRKSEAAVRVDTVSEAAKTLLQGPTTFNQPVERSTQKVLDNYFVPQGRTVRSVSSRSSDHPCGSTTSDSVLPSEGSDLDIITGATAQLWSKPKTLPAPLGDDILLKYRPAYHPLLQAVKLNQEYFRRAERTKDEDLKVVALRSASELQTDLLRSISQEEFLNIFNWNPKLEFDEYLNTQKGRNFLKERGAEVTPTPSPEVQMQPQETGMPQAHPPEQQTEHQPQSQMYYHPNGYYYPYPPRNPTPQAQYWPQQGYNQEYSTFQQGYYPPQQMVNNLVPQAEQ